MNAVEAVGSLAGARTLGVSRHTCRARSCRERRVFAQVDEAGAGGPRQPGTAVASQGECGEGTNDRDLEQRDEGDVAHC